ncbi:MULTISPECIES: SdrD B-like domain-containing protein [unclassified Micromonospora]|uniref:SdrD B-like domain-containing protein n=1 Tax=unclassified Micromonospora TaxID=2617518 RepID=UPI00333426FA
MRPHPLSRSIRRIFATSTATLALLGATAALAPADAVAAGRTQPDLFVDLLMTDHFNPAEGETFRAQIDVRNGGTGESDPLSVTVSVPAGLRTTALTATDGWNCAVVDEASYTCAHPALPAAGRAQRLSLPFVVAGAQPGSRVPITATIAPQRQESDTTNNTSSVTVAISGTCVVRGVVWHDLDRDGQRDEGEPGIGAGPDGVLSVRVGARQSQTTGGGTAVVNPDGTWSLTTRTELLYQVWVEAAGTYGRTASDVGDDATDSDMVTTYQSAPYLLTSSAEFFATHGGEYVVDTGLVTLN